MEISRDQAIEFLKHWKQNETIVGLHFAARGGTAGSTMLAKLTEVSSRVVFRNDLGFLRFSLYKARFAYGRVRVFLHPSREGRAEVEGLHIWLESGHWLFICDSQGLGREWLEATGMQGGVEGPGELLESQPCVEPAMQDK